MRRSLIGLAALGATALLVAGAVVPRGGQAAPAPAGPSGAYAFSLSTHDASTGQEGAGVGAMVLDAGNITGTISENERFNPASNGSGDLLVTHVSMLSGTYLVRADGSATLDICINNPSGPVRAVFEGAFSNAFRSLRILLSEIGTTLSCNASLTQAPNITSGTADKL